MTHTQDSDCTVNSKTNLCEQCGVEHGEACSGCGGRAFHADDCDYEYQEEEEEGNDFDDEPHPDTDSLEDRGIYLGSYGS